HARLAPPGIAAEPALRAAHPRLPPGRAAPARDAGADAGRPGGDRGDRPPRRGAAAGAPGRAAGGHERARLPSRRGRRGHRFRVRLGLRLGRGGRGPDQPGRARDHPSRGRAARRVPRPVTARAAWRAAPALLAGAAASALLLAPSLRIPGHRGGSRIASGFVPGRWDARFVVARGPAAITVPREPVRATLRLSGPATLTVRTPEGQRTVALRDEPAAVEVSLSPGGRAELVADGALRLHEVVLARRGPVPWARVALIVLAAVAAAAIGVRVSGAWGLAASIGLVSLVAALMIRGRLGGLALAVGFDRTAPALILLALAALFFLPWLLPRSRIPARSWEDRWPVAFGLLALVSCLALVLLRTQPLVIGDPAAYHDIGRRFAEAMGGVRGLSDVGDAAHTLRPYGGLAAIGLLYGVLLLI